MCEYVSCVYALLCVVIMPVCTCSVRSCVCVHMEGSGAGNYIVFLRGLAQVTGI